MSTPFDDLRRLAATNASSELGRRVREIGMQNRGPVIDQYLRDGGVSNATLGDPSESGAANRMWCGYFVYFCYLQASRHLNQSLPFTGNNLAGGRKLRIWAHSNSAAIITNSIVEAGDIFATNNDHIGMATGPVAGGVFPTIEGNQGEVGSSWNGIQRLTKNPTACRIIVRI